MATSRMTSRIEQLRFGRAAVTTAALVVASASIGQATVAGDLCSAVANPCVVNAAVSITPGSTLDFGTRALQLGSQAKLDVGAAALTIIAGPVVFAPGAKILAATSLAGGNISIQSTGSIELQASGPNKGEINVSTSGAAGTIELEAGGSITVAGKLLAVGTDPFAGGGSVVLTAGGTVTLTPSSEIKLRGGNQADGGDLVIDAGGTVELQSSLDLSGGDSGGGSLEVMTAAGDVFLRSAMTVAGGGFSGDGGSLSIDANGAIQILAPIAGQAAGDSEDGGGSGADVDLFATQSITISGALNLVGGFPDGEGGAVDLVAGGAIVLSATVDVTGQGIEGCGGSVLMEAGGSIMLNKILGPGGDCGGGDVLVTALGNLTVPQNINVDGASFSAGGSIELQGRDVSVTNSLRAVSTSGLSGEIVVRGCNVTIGSGGELRALGQGGGNAIFGSGQITVAGKMLAGSPLGANRLVYRDALVPPITSGATITPVALLAVDPTLPPCPGAGALCGDGTVDAGEQCDDANANPCDGCSPSCRLEGCGNGRVECLEECDSGALNGTPGNACALDCTIILTPGGLQLIPGGKTQNDCQVEWAVKNPGGDVVDGFPAKTQDCIDGDPGCDTDGAKNGACVFDVAACLASNDTRLPNCQPPGIQYVTLQKPNILTSTDVVDLANGHLLRDAVAALGVTIRVGSNVVFSGVPVVGRDVCTASVGITIPHLPGLIGSRTIEVASRDTNGGRMRDNHVTLLCRPNPAVCGNGVIEVTEQCDDGNATPCDGCSAACRVEACGNGVVECAEQCDQGVANGSPGGPCTTSCTEAAPALRIPGGGSKQRDCLVEFSLNTESPRVDRSGLPSKRQDCTDNDPACDLDPAPGTCRFKGWICVGGEDPRIACLSQPVATLELLKPRTRDVGALAELREAVLQQLAGIPLPTAGGETCTARIELTMEAGRKPLSLSVRGRDPFRKSDRDTLKLRCLVPRP